MLLNEFIYNKESTNDIANDHRYSAERDQSVIKRSDTRKLKLTLKQINQLRRQSEAHEFELESEKEFIKQMYGQKPQQQ